ncbi:MAG: hypothetical protein A3C93_05735 [Candidatus Lloydbacteria bacterium RIFCSPHIGHO2_02_FULL_54_17]|uniref:Uncharacterized protein n=1 Tax=Candidatus Lloydbacteria bacterium RIFCSPHIGHO2_02_FULL_54_17 TaxID=1798664 RepID=A0A1G2DAX5_9BACT|nr:MAG: hypothetical protein A2762_03205 [Candidatus Lloydbacteria bacterium RIFCSPHIGHO2_01_FULL_54_11]OGZ10785.1 MAG: hypothetical protein A3C93_05735 [Candidatus Lloydbacteria bacterium RIFCSPHIGHO2_02_FULL_54_17]OGZ13086.1 MAG: hypothetical protein A2948_03715 [Candidatus Lloydbacteria bacterium RIFCSPLOWO2_01_FULL_54_18]OGZ16533.1 MAG: hypothetical protein A3H76_04575 [Candidatus Lloydbacteria bacterium RIFCSPLOWO2_02_FULL_54_12]
MRKTRTLSALFASLFAASVPSVALAACTVTGNVYENPIRDALNICSIPDLLLALVDLVFLIGVPIVVIFIIYGGFLFVKSGDNESELAKAKNVMTWTLVGALVLLGAKAISLAIQGTITSLQ